MSIFKSQALTAAGPATDILPVTPNDGADLSFVASALYVETGGILSILTVRDQVRTIEVGESVLVARRSAACSRDRHNRNRYSCAGGRMKLDYALQTNSATIAGKLAWSPARLFAKGQRGAFFFRAARAVPGHGRHPTRKQSQRPGRILARSVRLWQSCSSAHHGTTSDPGSAPSAWLGESFAEQHVRRGRAGHSGGWRRAAGRLDTGRNARWNSRDCVTGA